MHIVKEMNKVGNRQKCCFEVFGFDIMFDQNLKPWVLEVNAMPSLSSSSVFDKQVKTMLIADTFSLIGIRGYDKNVFRENLEKEKEKGIKREYKPEDPPFKQTLTIDEVENMGGCLVYDESDPKQIMAKINKNLSKNNLEDNYVVIEDNRKQYGSGTGFEGNELLSKDELNLIMDLEDE